jgi:RIO kinase 1
MFSEDELDDYAGLPRIKNMPSQNGGSKNKKPKPNGRQAVLQVQAELAAQDEEQRDYAFTYVASRHERLWIMDSLGAFYELRWFTDLLRLIKGGKEASVYQCQAGPGSPVSGMYMAAKVYRPRKFRSLKNDFLYREGRVDLDINGNIVHNSGMLHAMSKRTAYGRELLHTSWIGHEYKTLQALHAAGADVPEPFASGDNAILMSYIGGDDLAAPTLNTVELDPVEALELYQRTLHNIELMLAHGRVHGDLSAFNILYWEGEITLIDFPQAISPGENRSAYPIFERDVTRVCEYFARQGIRSQPRQLAEKMWKGHHLRRSPQVDLRLLDAEDERDRQIWQSELDEA